MKLYGRITLVGEYLADRCGIVVFPSKKLYLSNFLDNPLHPTYKREADRVLKILKSYNINSGSEIFGTLPFDIGMASSSCLCIIHASRNTVGNDLREITNRVDWLIHGFRPSGLDYYSIISQSTGIYFEPNIFLKMSDLSIPSYDIISLSREDSKELKCIRNQVRSNKRLIEIGYNIINKILEAHIIDNNYLFEYCSELFKMGLYSKRATEIIDYFLENKIPAKCIGGLYDKAVIVFGITDMARAEIAVRYKFEHIE